MCTTEESAEISALYLEIQRLQKKKKYQPVETNSHYEVIEKIEYAALKRVTGLDKYMTIEILSYRGQTYKLSITHVRPIGMDKLVRLELHGNLVRMDGTVGVKQESAYIFPQDKLKRRLINGSWIDLPNPDSYLT